MASLLARLFYMRRLARSFDGFATMPLLMVGNRLGLFESLQKPATADALAERHGLQLDLLEAWLHASVEQSILCCEDGVYRLDGFARWILEDPESRALQAFIDQSNDGFGQRFHELPQLLRGAERPFFGSPDEAQRTAAASLLMEEPALRALKQVPRFRAARRILDVGCGYGSYLSRLLAGHRDAHGVGIELNPEIAEAARAALIQADVARRAEVRVGDFMAMDLTQLGSFDLILLNHNLYYFAPDEHELLFQRMLRHLSPRGVVAVQTAVHSDSALARFARSASWSSFFDLYLRLHRNLYRLPDPNSLAEDLLRYGFTRSGQVPIFPGGASQYIWGQKGR